MKVTYCYEGVRFKTCRLDRASAGEIANLIWEISQDCGPDDDGEKDCNGNPRGDLRLDGESMPLRQGLIRIGEYVRKNRDDFVKIFGWPRKWFDDTWFTERLRHDYAYLAEGERYTVIDASRLDGERLKEAVSTAVFPVSEYCRLPFIWVYFYGRRGSSRQYSFDRPEEGDFTLAIVPYRPGDHELDAMIIAADPGTAPCFGFVHASGYSIDIIRHSVKRPYRKILCRFASFIAGDPDLSILCDGRAYFIHDDRKKLGAWLSRKLWKRIVKTPPEQWSRDMITDWRASGIDNWLPF